MPRTKGPDGRWIRAAYRPEDYTVPDEHVRRLLSPDFRGTIEELTPYDGCWSHYDRMLEHERDGLRWALLRVAGTGSYVEVELTETAPYPQPPPPPRIRVWPPEEAWVFERMLDAHADPPVGLEGDPPPGVEDPAAGR